MPKRYKLRFPDRESYQIAQKITTENAVVRRGELSEFGNSLLQVKNEKRQYISVEPSRQLSEDLSELQLDKQINNLNKEFNAEIVEDFQYSLEANLFDHIQFSPDDPNDPSLDDVIKLIEADKAWESSTGEGVTIAVVDTGIDGRRLEFPKSKRVGQWQPINDQPWTDWKGHGTMCAAIAAGTRAAGGTFNGVAPDASLIACKTHFYDSELAAIYDYLIDFARTENLNLITTNSFGISTGDAPDEDPNSDFIPALNEALDSGIKVFFSAGNYHDLAGGAPDDCRPTSIWQYKCLENVMTTATCDLDFQMWYYSSRGPGQYFGNAGSNSKPDVTAPTPASGRVVYGNTIKSLPNGWGTSGACPQTAGLAALLLSRRPSLSYTEIFEIIRSTATSLPFDTTCCGAGLINCKRAIDSL